MINVHIVRAKGNISLMPSTELASGDGDAIPLQKASLHIPLGLWVGCVPCLALAWGSLGELAGKFHKDLGDNSGV